MKKSIILVFLIVLIILVTGCDNIDISKLSDEDLARISGKAVVCNKPYIRVGIECCLDKNDNQICDDDEGSQEASEGETTEFENFCILSPGFCDDFAVYPNYIIIHYNLLDAGDSISIIDDFIVGDCSRATIKEKEDDLYEIEFSGCNNGHANSVFNEDIAFVINPGKTQELLTGQIKSKILESEEIAEETENTPETSEPPCSDDCSSADCYGLDYFACIMQSDGCRDKINKGKVKGKCGVECLSGSDCNKDYECKDYKCKEEVKELIYSMNQDINVDYLTYKVTKAQTFTKMGNSIFNKETTGKFVKVYLSITNNAKETKQIFTPRFKLIDNQDRKFDRISDDMFYIADYLEFGEQLQPSLTVYGAIVFEFPKDSDGLKLEISGDWLSATKVTITLSNIQNIGIDTTLKDEQDEMMDDLIEEAEEQVEEIMRQCNSPFKCSSDCAQYSDVGQKDCPSGQVCCMVEQSEVDEQMQEIEEQAEEMVEELMNQCNSPFVCTSSCPEYMDVGQKDCPSGQLCCLQ